VLSLSHSSPPPLSPSSPLSLFRVLSGYYKFAISYPWLLNLLQVIFTASLMSFHCWQRFKWKYVCLVAATWVSSSFTHRQIDTLIYTHTHTHHNAIRCVALQGCMPFQVLQHFATPSFCLLFIPNASSGFLFFCCFSPFVFQMPPTAHSSQFTQLTTCSIWRLPFSRRFQHPPPSPPSPSATRCWGVFLKLAKLHASLLLHFSYFFIFCICWLRFSSFHFSFRISHFSLYSRHVLTSVFFHSLFFFRVVQSYSWDSYGW